MIATPGQQDRAFTGSPYLHELGLRLPATNPTSIPLATLEAFVKDCLGPAAQSDAGATVLAALSYYAKQAELYGALFPDATICATPQSPPEDISLPAAFVGQLSDQPVVLSVLDEGLPFLHKQTVAASGQSRCLAVWLQDARARSGQTGQPPFGRYVHQTEIQTLLDADLHEEDGYRRIGAIDQLMPTPQRLLRQATHGSAVLGLAAGTAEDKHLLMGVNFPPTAVQDTSGTLLPFFILLGICFSLQQSQRLAKQLKLAAPARFADVSIPVVINLSYGVLAGPKNGSGILENVMEQLSGMVPKSIPGITTIKFVLPMGNGRQSQTASRLAGQTRSLTLRLIPDDKTPSFVEVWADGDASETHSKADFMTLTSPHTNKDLLVPRIQFGTYEVLEFECGTKVRVYADQRQVGTKTRDLLLIAFPPTAGLERAQLARPGDWLINDISSAPSSVDVFVQRDEALEGLDSGGRQSRFIDESYRRYTVDGFWAMDDLETPNCPVKRQGTVSAFANAKKITRVGSNIEQTGELSVYSAMAFPDGKRSQDGDKRKPVDQSYNTSGLEVAGTRTCARQRLSGTSLAAPMVAADMCRRYK